MTDTNTNPRELNEDELKEASGGKWDLFRRKNKVVVSTGVIFGKKGVLPENVPEDYIQWECPQNCDVVAYTEPGAQAPVCTKHGTKCLRVYKSIQF